MDEKFNHGGKFYGTIFADMEVFKDQDITSIIIKSYGGMNNLGGFFFYFPYLGKSVSSC